MKLKLLALACLATLAIAGCKPQPPAEPAAPAAAPAPAEVAAPAVADAPIEFSQKAFAGSFSGADTKLMLAADGSYQIAETHQGEKKGDGTWTAEENGKRVRLDPNSKSEEDRLYEIVGNDEIRLLGKDGQPAASGPSLKRDAAAK
ncbi:copper resistance protein NlpE N-terminal domain-containing protein [Lysobacter koreensis]|uniref:Copper resistance protein NlpE N-terminal domain-containing protein n=1 Tax=Lysobacter koreensis TaxID=266122 RepID=A0ABW2YKG4_9GAMM